jgi:hypothetical protein
MESGIKRKVIPLDPRRKAKDFPKVDPPKDVRKVSSADALSKIRDIAAGWKDDFGKLLGLPRELYFYNEGNLLVLSKDETLSVMKFLPAMRLGGEPPKDISAYGIIIYETSSSAFFVFVDTDRRIAVKESIASFHSGREDWSHIMELVREAVSISDSEPKSRKGIALVDAVEGRREFI